MSGSISRGKKRILGITEEGKVGQKSNNIQEEVRAIQDKTKRRQKKGAKNKKRKRIESTLSRVDIKYQALHPTLVSPHLIVVEAAAPT